MNGETALAFKHEALATELARMIVEQDLRYSRLISAEEAEEFADPKDVVCRFRERIGRIFEEEL